MKRLVISGYYGFDNLGDEAVLESILKNIRSALGELHITVLSANPEATASAYGVHAVRRTSPLGVLKAVWNCDVLVSGGGSLLQDVTSHLSIFYYLTLIALGKLLGKKVMIYSQGIGPIRKPASRLMTRWILGRVDAITVREPNSKTDLIGIGIRPECIDITADPVIGLEPGPDFDLKEWLRSQQNYRPELPVVGMAFRGQDLKFGAAEKLDQVIRELDRIRGVNVVLIPYYRKQDEQMLDSLAARSGSLVLPLRRQMRVSEMVSLTQGLDVLVGSRLHSLIVSAVCATPMIAVSYDPKIEYFMETIGDHICADIRNFEPKVLVQGILHALENRAPLSAQLERQVQVLREKLHVNETALKRLLN